MHVRIVMLVPSSHRRGHHPLDQGGRSRRGGHWCSTSGSAGHCCLPKRVTRETDREKGRGDKAINYGKYPCWGPKRPDPTLSRNLFEPGMNRCSPPAREEKGGRKRPTVGGLGARQGGRRAIMAHVTIRCASGIIHPATGRRSQDWGCATQSGTGGRVRARHRLGEWQLNLRGRDLLWPLHVSCSRRLCAMSSHSGWLRAIGRWSSPSLPPR
jgi:hypothetical protein